MLKEINRYQGEKVGENKEREKEKEKERRGGGGSMLGRWRMSIALLLRM